MQDLLKDHPSLCLGLNVLLPPEYQLTIPPEASEEFHKVVGRSVPVPPKVVGRSLPRPEPTIDDATSYLIAVKEAFHDEPAKYGEMLKLLKDFKARRYVLVLFSMLCLIFSVYRTNTLCELILMLLSLFVESMPLVSLLGWRNS